MTLKQLVDLAQPYTYFTLALVEEEHFNCWPPFEGDIIIERITKYNLLTYMTSYLKHKVSSYNIVTYPPERTNEMHVRLFKKEAKK